MKFLAVMQVIKTIVGVVKQVEARHGPIPGHEKRTQALDLAADALAQLPETAKGGIALQNDVGNLIDLAVELEKRVTGPTDEDRERDRAPEATRAPDPAPTAADRAAHADPGDENDFLPPDPAPNVAIGGVGRDHVWESGLETCTCGKMTKTRAAANARRRSARKMAK